MLYIKPYQAPGLLIILVILDFGCHSQSQTNEKETDSRTDETTDAIPDGGLSTETDTDSETETELPIEDLGLVINELMAKNDGVVLDEALETEDWLEILNQSNASIDLSDFTIEDNQSSARLPDITLGPNEVILLFADNEPEQGERHLPLKLSAAGEHLYLKHTDGRYADYVEFSPMPMNESIARLPDGKGPFSPCRYATPGNLNHDACVPPVQKGLDSITFAPFTWPTPFPKNKSALVINELALRPAQFIEILNTSDTDISLEQYVLTINSHYPGLPWPEISDGVDVPLPKATLAANKRMTVSIDETMTAALSTDPLFEGVVTLFDPSGQAADRVDFMSWPKETYLAREPDGEGRLRFCTNHTKGLENQCIPLLKRTVDNRLRYLRTENDFNALAEGSNKFGIGSVKFVIDLVNGATHLLSSATWPLHFTFVTEIIDGNPPLDRCDPTENALFNEGWRNFSSENYYTVEERRYLLGTLSHHGGADLKCVEYTFGDAISPEQMKDGFFEAASHTIDPQAWNLRPQDDNQVEKAREVEGTLPIVGPTEPFANIEYQPLTEGVGFGYLTFLTTDTLPSADLGPDKIVVINDVPNDIPFVGGLITEAFQTPLAHVNILSRSRNTPNMALVNAKQHSNIAPFEGKLVKLQVMPTHFTIEEADPDEAAAHFAQQHPTETPRTLDLDLSMTDLVPLDEDVGFEQRTAIGVKAAQLAELHHVSIWHGYCPKSTLPLPLPHDAFAIPVIHYADHFEESGAAQLLDQLLIDDTTLNNGPKRIEALDAIRDAILTHPVSTPLLNDLEHAIRSRFGTARVRFRSSSTAEDLSDFNGAGLYTSKSAELDNPDRTLSDALRTVWASLWNARAFDERAFSNIDQSAVAMGVLVHEAFLSEEANGVAVSRDIADPTRGDRYYVNVQAGEATVTNPAPGISTETFIYQWPSRRPTIRLMSQSSLIDGPVLLNTDNTENVSKIGEVIGETRNLMCALYSVHRHFKQLLDPNDETPWFTMEIEFKQRHENRDLVIKQARPYSFGRIDMPDDCR